MKSYTMTEAETKGWESEDAQTADAVRREVRAKAMAKAKQFNEKVEIYTEDGIVMDVVEVMP